MSVRSFHDHVVGHDLVVDIAVDASSGARKPATLSRVAAPPSAGFSGMLWWTPASAKYCLIWSGSEAFRPSHIERTISSGLGMRLAHFHGAEGEVFRRIVPMGEPPVQRDGNAGSNRATRRVNRIGHSKGSATSAPGSTIQKLGLRAKHKLSLFMYDRREKEDHESA
ncbi:hypothetical protein [Streptomyces mirabilis]|uniref:hypothetical protein n=1 Tax=Streptomyces mirabilis TaxID=68239 RepID=UPI0036500ABC